MLLWRNAPVICAAWVISGDPRAVCGPPGASIIERVASEATREPGRKFLKWRLSWALAPAAALVAFGSWSPILEYVRTVSSARQTPAQHVFRPKPAAPVRIPIENPGVLTARSSRPVVIPAIPEPPSLTIDLGPTAADLDSAELAAHVALHRLGLCRWQAIEVLRLPGRAIRITGVVERSEQIEQLKSALAGVGSLQFELLAMPESMPADSEPQPETRLQPRPPLLEKKLEEYFLRQLPRDQVGRSIAAFCGLAMELSATAHSESQAVSALAAAFPDGRLQRMSESERTRFFPIVEDHMRERRQSLAQLRALLDRLGNGVSSVEQEPAPPTRWEESCRLMALRTARMDYLVSGLFAGLDLHGLTGDQAWRELLDTQAQSMALLDASELSLRSSFEARNR